MCGSCCADILLARGALVDARNATNDTALMGAASDRHDELAQFLLDHGADINARASDFVTALKSVACCSLHVQR